MVIVEGNLLTVIFQPQLIRVCAQTDVIFLIRNLMLTSELLKYFSTVIEKSTFLW